MLQWAVTDGPDGRNAVALPDDVAAARALVTHHRGRFWCATRAGGCGERLLAGAGGFRHAEASSWCRLAAGDAGPAYEHLRYEPGLTGWLAEQGFAVRSRALRTVDGAVDLQLVVDAVDALLAVQFSPLSDAAWRDLDDAHRRRHRHVTWLHGPGATDAAAAEAAVRGAALQLRRQGRGLVAGVRDADGRLRWVPLAACRLTPDGVTAPGLAEARAAHAQRTVARRAAARRAARPAPAAPEQLAFPV